MRLDRIPEELRALPQWVCHTETKVPINPRTGTPASVTDPATWVSFAEASRAAEQYAGVGFVLTETDPYAFVDLDAKSGNTAEELRHQQEIYEELDSYTETSPSGRGLHIIVRAECAAARRRGPIEVYDRARYMTMTGDVYRDAPIQPRQRELDAVMRRLGGGVTADDVPVVEEGAHLSDDEVLSRMMRASNADKVGRLLAGDWENSYSSQSEADFALVNHLTWYTRNTAQIVRLFRGSGLGARKKAQRDDYVVGMVRRALSESQSQIVSTVDIDIDAIIANLLPPPPKPSPTPKMEPEPVPDYTTHDVMGDFPGGLVADIAAHFYHSYSRPVKDISIAGALGFMAGLCGRAYNISGTGLNQYILVLAKTGVGKDAMEQGISRLRFAVEKDVPSASKFVAPAFASGQAMLRYLSEESSSCVSILGEFGKTMKRMTARNVGQHDQLMLQLYLELFSKSGKGLYLPSRKFSDKSKDLESVLSPSLSLLAEGTPEGYYSTLDESSISDGFLPRFLVIEYTGQRPRRQKTSHAVQAVPAALVERVSDLAHLVLRMNQQNDVIEVSLDAEAAKELDAFDEFADDQINDETASDSTRQLWNRAHLKALKLAAILAVGNNMYNPVVSAVQARWAIDLVQRDVRRVLQRFQDGLVGAGSATIAIETQQRNVVMRNLQKYLHEGDAVTNASTRHVKPGMRDARVIPHSTLRIRSVPAMGSDGRRAFEATISDLLEDGIIALIDRQYMDHTWGYKGRAYKIIGVDASDFMYD
jgi:hypothetical protein